MRSADRALLEQALVEQQGLSESTMEWRKAFKSVEELEKGEIQFYIDRILPEGVTFLGALSGSGKTLFALSMVRALTNGKPFLNNFKVSDEHKVIYLIPEAGARSFRKRCEAFGIKENFLCRTMKDGPIQLNDQLLLAAVAELKPIVFLDTAIRFTDGEENSSSDNQKGLADAVFNLLRMGAKAVVGVHHSSKASRNAEEMTLENVLRGTGDIGAMCDAVYGLKLKDLDTTRILVKCVKPRDFEPVRPFEIVGRPFIDEMGDFALTEPETHQDRQAAARKKLEDAVIKNPRANVEELQRASGVNKNNVAPILNELGWGKAGREWVRKDTTLLKAA